MNRILFKWSLALLGILIIGLLTVGHYGVNWDEALHINGVKAEYRFVTHRQPVQPDVLRYHGQAFDVLAEMIYQLQQYTRQGLSYRPFFYQGNPAEKVKQLRQRIENKHVLIFLTSFIAYLSVAAMIGIFCGYESAWFGMIVLALFPSFWGHSFFNQKDIPFAALFTLGIYRAAVWLNQFEEWSNARLPFRRLLFSSILYGVLAGLCSGIRFPGFVLMGILFGTHFLLSIEHKNFVNLLSPKGILCYALIILSWFAITLISYPSFWFDPLGLFSAISYFSKFPKAIPVLFEGRLFAPTALPWYYLPKVLILTTPLLFQVFFLIGFVAFLRRYASMSFLQRACFILLLFQIVIFPLATIFARATMYNNARHFLFVIPGLAVIASSAMIQFYQSISLTLSRRIISLIGMGFLGIIIWTMVKLHPYEYIYFNGIAGGVEGAAQKYEKEYWGLSFREAAAWINRQNGAIKRIIVAGPVEPAAVFADPSLVFEIYHGYSFLWTGDVFTPLKVEEGEEPRRPFYYLSLNELNYPRTFPGCPVVYQVFRDKVPLAIIKKCE